MGKLTTHVLDTMSGRPGTGMQLALYRVDGADRVKLAEARTNEQGRLDRPMLEGASMGRGTFELIFQVGHYFKLLGVDLPNRPFLDEVPIRFGIEDPGADYHVPLVVSPFAYSTYRGS
jgi:5-hydroxyisourate hydrolase